MGLTLKYTLLQDPKHCATGCCQLERGTICLLKLTEINDVGDPISLVQSRKKKLCQRKWPQQALLVGPTSSLGRIHAMGGQPWPGLCSRGTYCLLCICDTFVRSPLCSHKDSIVLKPLTSCQSSEQSVASLGISPHI